MWKRKLLKLIVLLSIPALIGGAVMFWIGAEKFIVPRRRALEERHVQALQNPREFGFDLESFAVGTDDGIELKAILIEPSTDPGAAVKTRRMRGHLSQTALPIHGSPGTVVMLHGRGGMKEDMFPIAERFVAAGFRCIAYDARAHGKSGGHFTTYGIRETEDLGTVLDTALATFGEELEPFVAFGNSLGAAVTLQALPKEPRLKSAVVVSPFADLNGLAHRAVRNVISPWTPPILTHTMVSFGGWRAGFSPSAIRPVKEAAKIKVPVMVVHGERDRVIPPAQGLLVFEAMRQPVKVWREVPGGYHYNVLATGGDALYLEMIEFWAATLP